MVRRYAHKAAEHLAPYADRLCALRVVEAASDGKIGHRAQTKKGLKHRNPSLDWRARQDKSERWSEVLATPQLGV